MKRILVVVLVIVGIAVVAGLGLLMAGVSFAVGQHDVVTRQVATVFASLPAVTQSGPSATPVTLVIPLPQSSQAVPSPIPNAPDPNAPATLLPTVVMPDYSGSQVPVDMQTKVAAITATYSAGLTIFKGSFLTDAYQGTSYMQTVIARAYGATATAQALQEKK